MEKEMTTLACPKCGGDFILVEAVASVMLENDGVGYRPSDTWNADPDLLDLKWNRDSVAECSGRSEDVTGCGWKGRLGDAMVD
jgi:hypothetical protein